MVQTPFLIQGMEYGNCNCAYGCSWVPRPSNEET